MGQKWGRMGQKWGQICLHIFTLKNPVAIDLTRVTGFLFTIFNCLKVRATGVEPARSPTRT